MKATNGETVTYKSLIQELIFSGGGTYTCVDCCQYVKERTGAKRSVRNLTMTVSARLHELFTAGKIDKVGNIGPRGGCGYKASTHKSSGDTTLLKYKRALIAISKARPYSAVYTGMSSAHTLYEFNHTVKLAQEALR